MRAVVRVIALLALSLPHTVGAADVRVERLDGSGFSAEWVGVRQDGTLAVRTDEGVREFAGEDVAEVGFTTRSSSRRPGITDTGGAVGTNKPVFFLADGGVLHGELLGSAPDAVLAKTRLGESLALKYDRLAAIQLAGDGEFARAGELFRAARAARLPGLDVLLTRSVDEPKTLRGRLESLDAAQGSFALGETASVKNVPRSFATEKIFGVVFAAGAGSVAPRPTTLHFLDGSQVSGRLLKGEGAFIRLEASISATVDVPIEDLRVMTFHSPRVILLDGLSPSGERSEGRLHRPWPARLNRNVAAGPLVLDGRTFRGGIGMHSRGELDFDLDGLFELFAATIGIDDSVRPRGSVVFRVIDGEKGGKVLFDSGLITGRDPARNIVVSISGVRKLTLVVDYGDELDLSDHADWGGARLLRPAGGAKPRNP